MDQDNLSLLKKAQNGDETALATLIEQNLGLVRSIAKRFLHRGCEYEDLIQIGSMGLLRAARSFDFGYQTMFSTYAVPLIIGEIRKFLRDDGIIKISRSVKERGTVILRQKEKFTAEHGREPYLSELSLQTGFSTEEIVDALEAISPIHSLHEPIGDDGEGTLENILADSNNVIENLTDKIALREAIGKLLPYQQEIIRMRYFCDLSQQQTGAALGLTQVKISREEKKILAILRTAL